MSTWLHRDLGWVLVTIDTALKVTQVEVQASIVSFFTSYRREFRKPVRLRSVEAQPGL